MAEKVAVGDIRMCVTEDRFRCPPAGRRSPFASTGSHSNFDEIEKHMLRHIVINTDETRSGQLLAPMSARICRSRKGRCRAACPSRSELLAPIGNRNASAIAAVTLLTEAVDTRSIRRVSLHLVPRRIVSVLSSGRHPISRD
jgi:hypothetical protein